MIIIAVLDPFTRFIVLMLVVWCVALFSGWIIGSDNNDD